jgi:hypothetical protein
MMAVDKYCLFIIIDTTTRYQRTKLKHCIGDCALLYFNKVPFCFNITVFSRQNIKRCASLTWGKLLRICNKTLHFHQFDTEGEKGKIGER